MKNTILIVALVLSYQVNCQSISNNVAAIDTTYYETDQVMTISFHNTSDATLNALNNQKLMKTVYQYDECGNLRNITRIYEIYIDPNIYGVMNPSRYHYIDEPLSDLVCDKLWVKPLMNYN